MDVRWRIEELLGDSRGIHPGDARQSMLTLAREIKTAALAAVKDCGEAYVTDHVRAIELTITID